MQKKKILLALSGGVDSSVAAALLLDSGYDVTAATIKYSINKNTDIIQKENIKHAAQVCEQLRIKHLVFDFTEDFKKKVIDYFVESYEKGKTPNPCFICNKKIKFGSFLKKATELNFDFIATGHYAKTVYDKNLQRYKLLYDAENPKDQTYFLAYLNQKQLSRIIFPLADLTKQQVKKIATKKNLKPLFRKESQDICFVENKNYTKIIEQFSQKKMLPGSFLTLDGKKVGEHKGIHKYTIGQRRGLDISLGVPFYVLEKNSKTNEIIVAKKEALYCKSLIAEKLNFIATEFIQKLTFSDLQMEAKTRYRAATKKCIVEKLSSSNFSEFEKNKLNPNARLKIHFIEQDFAVAAGQAVVLYFDGEVIASGIILKAITK